ncbi:hypothetical protein H4Q26_011804 [Puccinia striiformis f. sp. tritici PST-130]|nr:hypothetical protein H4Q26_011804 [Puccinia striiformis f. sp. tritici PST-130]
MPSSGYPTRTRVPGVCCKNRKSGATRQTRKERRCWGFKSAVAQVLTSVIKRPWINNHDQAALQRRITDNTSDSLKRKNFSPTNPDSHVSKRPACHLINDVSQNSNSINPRLNSDSARSSKSLLDHQSSRSNNENHATPQDIEFNQSQSNEPSGSSLLQRISLPFKDNSRIV